MPRPGGTVPRISAATYTVIETSKIAQRSIWPSVVSDDPERLRTWLVAIGFTEDLLIPGERPGAIHHSQFDWPDGGRVMLSGTGERATPARPGTLALHVVCSDPGVVLQRARALDARVLAPIVDQTDYPAREFTVADPDGNAWTFSTFAG